MSAACEGSLSETEVQEALLSRLRDLVGTATVNLSRAAKVECVLVRGLKPNPSPDKGVDEVNPPLAGLEDIYDALRCKIYGIEERLVRIQEHLGE